MLEKPENFGEVTQVDGENVRKWKVDRLGLAGFFYAKRAGCDFGEGELQVTPEQALRVMGGWSW